MQTRSYKQCKLIQDILLFEMDINNLVQDNKLKANLLRLANSQKKLINSFFNSNDNSRQ